MAHGFSGLITFSLIRTEVSVGQLKDGVAIDAGFGLLPHRLAPKGMEIIHLQVTASAYSGWSRHSTRSGPRCSRRRCRIHHCHDAPNRLCPHRVDPFHRLPTASSAGWWRSKHTAAAESSPVCVGRAHHQPSAPNQLTGYVLAHAMQGFVGSVTPFNTGFVSMISPVG